MFGSVQISPFFGLIDDIFLCFVYDPPENSSFTKRIDYDILDLIEQNILKFSQKGKIIIAGDLNSRIGEELDFILSDSDKHLPLYDSYKYDENLVIKTSSDKILNSRGRQLLSLCISSGTRVLNGRTFVDLCGSYNCYQPSGSSVVDYMLVSEDLLTSVSYFLVHNLSDLSDHCQISCMIQCNYNIVQKENTGL